jgi:nitroreductase
MRPMRSARNGPAASSARFADLLPEGNLAGSIYGIVLVTSVLATLDKSEERVGFMIASVLVTSLVFALAHAWAQALDATAATRTPVDRRAFARAFGHEWPIVQSGLPAAIALALAAVGLYSVDTGLWVAVVVNVCLLFVWGAGLRELAGGNVAQVVVAGLSSASLGLLLVLLKVVVH